MLPLELRSEFLQANISETNVNLRGDHAATERPAQQFLQVTYPTNDLVRALQAVSTDRKPLPLVLRGSKGRGKSHLLAVLHHSIAHPDAVESYAQEWGKRLQSPILQNLSLARGFFPITEVMSDQEYGPFLWNLIFERHPEGKWARGKFEASGNPIPSKTLLKELFAKHPTALILDELELWYTGLQEVDEQQRRPRAWANTTIQHLSELAKEHPENLILICSVLSNRTEAYSQLHRVSDLIDFSGPTSSVDRRNVVLHRLFANRGTFSDADIAQTAGIYADERIRLRFSGLAGPERALRKSEVFACWPFAPELLDLLERQILMAENAQETRDAIKILASLARTRAKHVPILTTADFRVQASDTAARALLNAIASTQEEERLSQVAARNLETVIAAGDPSLPHGGLPHAEDIISSLWVHSIGGQKDPGATRTELQLACTRDAALDDNAFRAEVSRLIDSSVNIHGELTNEVSRVCFRQGENPRTLVQISARNDKIWRPGGDYAGRDVEWLMKSMEALLRPDGVSLSSTPIVLGPQWRTNPWSEVDETRHPRRWEHPVLIVIPDPPEDGNEPRDSVLGRWLRDQVPVRRNFVRFLLVSKGMSGIFADSALIRMARQCYLTSPEGWGRKGERASAPYADLYNGFRKPFQDALKKRFDRFAILSRWNFKQPEACQFQPETLTPESLKRHNQAIPLAVEDLILEKCFDRVAFSQSVKASAAVGALVEPLLRNFEEPPANPETPCLPWLGERAMAEALFDEVYQGNVAIYKAGTWFRREAGHESFDAAKKALSSSLFVLGQALRNLQLGLPEQVSVTTLPDPKSMMPSATAVAQPGLGAGDLAGWPSSQPAPGPYAPYGANTQAGFNWITSNSSHPTSSAVGGDPPPISAQPTVRRSGTQTPFNIKGWLEAEKIALSVPTRIVLEFPSMTGDALKKILGTLPSGVKLEVSVELPPSKGGGDA